MTFSEFLQPANPVFRYSLPGFFLLFILVNGPLSALAFRRRYGFDPTVLTDPDPIMDFGERCRNVLLAVVLVLTAAYGVWPEIQHHLGPIRFLERPGVRAGGLFLLATAMVLVRVGQLNLRSSWRFGVDRAHPPDEVVTRGLFAYSRHPIFVGLLSSAVGLFLALPNAVTFAVAPVTYVLLAIRARREEEFMEETWGDEYRRYRAATPRWLIGPRG